MSQRKSVGELQYAILSVLWSGGPATVSEVHQRLSHERQIAPTTTATMLVKMEKRGLVGHTTEGRKFIYAAAVSEREVRSSMLDDLRERLFDGSAAALVSHLLEEHEVDSQELQQIRRAIRRAEQDAARTTSRADDHPGQKPTEASR